ncbi:MAG TPA: hypothetical protein PLW10_07765, partial [Myxococcota bacterium]|nr:hypothetical protein [Myxococcota bacterium]
HPLPEDFTGGGAQARAYTPAEDWVFRNLTIQFEDGNHLSPMSMMFATKGMAGLEIDNVTMRGAYRQFMIIERGADVRVHHSDFFDMTWDKATNGYGFIIAESSRVWLHDNHIQHVTGIAFSNNSQHVLVTYNDIRAPSINPRFNVSCRGNDGDGGGNDCDIDLSTHLSHGPTVGNGYLHCSTNEDDLLGYRGDASCRGTPAGAVYSCVEWHDRSASNTLFMRNYCEGPIWFDNAFGPGRNNFLYGNWLSTPVEGTPNFNTNPGDSGDFAFRDVGGALPSGYRQNAIWANNLLEGSFGVMNGYNAYGDGVRAEDNVILGSCRDADAAGHDADGGACSNDSELRGGVNGVWANNTVGAPTHGPGYSRTMPTLPGFTDWPEFSVTPEIPGPYIGPEMGNPASTTKCLPAWQRFNGGC